MIVDGWPSGQWAANALMSASDLLATLDSGIARAPGVGCSIVSPPPSKLNPFPP
jgi:hypothetical protein